MSLLEKAGLIVTPNAYKTSKLYSVVPNTTLGDMDVVRGTTATRVNSAGLIESVGLNIPRIDYTNGSCPSILVEPQRTNLLTYSEQFDDASWNKVNLTITQNSINSPSGIINADTITDNSTNGLHVVVKFSTWMATTQTASVYAKAGTSSKIFIGNLSQGRGSYFDLSTQTIVNSSLFSGIITSVGNGWYRLIATHTSGTDNQTFGIGLFTGTSTTSYIGTGQNAYLWGAQLEAGSYATSYIPTVASTVTRNADVISKTGISSLIGQTEGVIFLDAIILPATSANLEILSLNDGTANNRLRIITASSQRLRFLFQLNGGIIQYDYTFGTGFAEQTRLKIAISYKSGNTAIYINGIKVNISTNILTISNTLSVLNLGNNSGALYEAINSAQLYKTQLTDTECIALTTL
jgi:hypothetical protein